MFHDETLDRTTNGSGLLRERSLAELAELDAGFRFEDAGGGHPHRGRGLGIPTLTEVLEAFPGVPLNIEVKQGDPPIEDAVVGLLDRHGAGGAALLAAADHTIMERLRPRAAGLLTGSSGVEGAAFVATLRDTAQCCDALPGYALQVPPSYAGMTVVDEDFVTGAHAVGAEVHVWTVNDSREVDRLLDLGVDGIMTDFPRMAAEVFARRGLR